MIRRTTIVTLQRLHQSSRIQNRCFSQVPPPTWSMNDLHLEATKHTAGEIPTIQDEELDILAQRCLLDVQRLSEQERTELKVELGKIMQCISLVCETNGASVTEVEMYDLPRGFDERSCPTRNEAAELNAWKKDGVKEDANYILQQLKEKTVRVRTNESGDEETYFSIIAKGGNTEDHSSS